MATFEEIAKANEQLKATDIRGKKYIEVNQRIKAFRMVYPEGFIISEIDQLLDGLCIFRARVGVYEVFADGAVKERVLGTGTAYEKEGSSQINRTSYIENCETSAIGRALGMAGFGIDTSVASAEEVENAIHQQEQGDVTITRDNMGDPMTEAQKNKIFRELDRAGFTRDVIEQSIGKSIDELSKIEASNLIERLMKR
ncbi:MAG: hypothetical protein IKG04_02580 [Exiguobacterium sp.]|nr:hypothetical protein [Exiguobacterium sp.]